MTLTMRAPVALATLAAASTLTACSSLDEPEVQHVATEFARLARTDPVAACTLLAPRTLQQVTEDGDGDCGEGLRSDSPEPAADVRSVSVAVNGAQVVLADQVVFLARFDSGWKVLAAGCNREGSDDALPYDCAVGGD